MSSKFEVRILNQNEYDQWDYLVENSNEGTIFHNTHWLKASGHKFKIIGCFLGEKLSGGAAFIINKNKIGQKYISPTPLTPYSGIIFEKSTSKNVTRNSNIKTISKKIIQYIKNKYLYIRIPLPPRFNDVQMFIWNKFEVEINYTFLLKLNKIDLVWEDMASSIRRDIRKAEKDGIKVKVTDSFDTMIALVKKTFKRQNNKFKNEKYALRYYNALTKINKCKSFISYDREKPLGGVHIVWDKKRSYYLLGGYDYEHSHHGASALAMWTAIKYTANELNLKEFDFEGSMIPPLEKYFRKFGGELVPKYIVYKRPLPLRIFHSITEYL